MYTAGINYYDFVVLTEVERKKKIVQVEHVA